MESPAIKFSGDLTRADFRRAFRIRLMREFWRCSLFILPLSALLVWHATHPDPAAPEITYPFPVSDEQLRWIGIGMSPFTLLMFWLMGDGMGKTQFSKLAGRTTVLGVFSGLGGVYMMPGLAPNAFSFPWSDIQRFHVRDELAVIELGRLRNLQFKALPVHRRLLRYFGSNLATPANMGALDENYFVTTKIVPKRLFASDGEWAAFLSLLKARAGTGGPEKPEMVLVEEPPAGSALN